MVLVVILIVIAAIAFYMFALGGQNFGKNPLAFFNQSDESDDKLERRKRRSPQSEEQRQLRKVVINKLIERLKQMRDEGVEVKNAKEETGDEEQEKDKSGKMDVAVQQVKEGKKSPKNLGEEAEEEMKKEGGTQEESPDVREEDQDRVQRKSKRGRKSGSTRSHHRHHRSKSHLKKKSRRSRRSTKSKSKTDVPKPNE